MRTLTCVKVAYCCTDHEYSPNRSVIYLADVNECIGAHDCQQDCQNTEGSYECSCREGFTIATDGRSCTGAYTSMIIAHEHDYNCFLTSANVPCDGACSFGCAVVNNEEQCFCPVGFQLDAPGGLSCVGKLLQ